MRISSKPAQVRKHILPRSEDGLLVQSCKNFLLSWPFIYRDSSM